MNLLFDVALKILKITSPHSYFSTSNNSQSHIVSPTTIPQKKLNTKNLQQALNLLHYNNTISSSYSTLNMYSPQKKSMKMCTFISSVYRSSIWRSVMPKVYASIFHNKAPEENCRWNLHTMNILQKNIMMYAEVCRK